MEQADYAECVRSLPITEAEGDALGRRLSAGDDSVIPELGVDVSGYDTTANEWGIASRGGEIVVIRGEPGAVDWNELRAQGVVPLGHTHPHCVLDIPEDGLPFRDVFARNRDPRGLVPSAQDLELILEYGSGRASGVHALRVQ